MPNHDDDRESRTRFRPQRRRRWVMPLLLLVVIAVIAVWFAPQLAVTEPVRNWLLAKALPGSPAQLDFESANVSWLAPIEINELTIRDEHQTVVSVGRLATSETLLSMLTHPAELGTVRLEAPTIQVVVDENGQNNLARLCGDRDWSDDAQNDTGTSQRPAVKLEVTDGRLLVSDRAQGREFVAENISLFVTLPVPGVEPIDIALSTIALDGAQQGSLAAHLTWWPHQNQQTPGEGNASVQAERFPITLATALAGAAGIQVQGTGSFDASLECDWKENAQGTLIPIKAIVAGRDVAVTLPELKGDTLSSGELQLELTALVDGRKLTIDRLQVTSDLGTLQASGAAPLNTFSAPDDQGLVANHQLELDGFVDLPRLATQLRNTMRLRDDAVLTDGQLRLAVTSKGTHDERTIRSRLTTDRLAATVGGKTVHWNEALSVDVAASHANGQLAIVRAVCETPFATVELTGDQTAGNLVAQCDLSALVSQLGQVVDFGDLQLTGTANTQGNWKLDDNLLTANLDTDCRDLAVVAGGTPVLTDSRVATRADCRLVTSSGTVHRVESASVQLTSGTDQMLIRLKQPLDAPGAASVWPIVCRISGDLASWTARLCPGSSWDVAGELDLEAAGLIAGTQLEVPSLTAELRNVVATSGTTRISEPTVKLQGNLRCDYRTLQVHMNQLSGTSATLAINSQDIDLSFPAGKPALSGIAAFRGDLGRLAALAMPRSSHRFAGTIEGQMSMAPEGDAVRLEGTTTLQDFAVFSPPSPGQPAAFTAGRQVRAEQLVWSEQSLQATIRGVWVPREDAVRFDDLQIVGDEAAVKLQGTVQQLTSAAIADLSGNVQYDLNTVSRKLNTAQPSGIRLAGQHESPLTVRGPLLPQSAGGNSHNMPVGASPVSSELFASTSLAWDSADFFGVVVGPQRVNVELNQGVLATSPIDATLSGGQLRATPLIDLRRQPIAITLAGETTLQNAQLTPEFCDQWIKYVAPLLAGAATASGDFSVVLNQATIPLGHPHLAELAGRFIVGTARVQPGAMARSIYTASQDFTSLLSQGNSPFSFMAPDQRWMELSNQHVDFQMTQGRIYHQNLNIGVGNVQVGSRGWVGLDQSVAIVAEIPVEDKWLGSSPMLAGLRGQTIQVPIHGTLTRPQLDRRALAQLSNQLIGNTAERLLDEQLQKGLQKLLGPK